MLGDFVVLHGLLKELTRLLQNIEFEPTFSLYGMLDLDGWRRSCRSGEKISYLHHCPRILAAVLSE